MDRKRKFHEKAKRIKIDAVNQAKEASHITSKATSIDNSRDGIDFTSTVASAESSKPPEKAGILNDKTLVKKKVTRWKDMDLKHFFKK